MADSERFTVPKAVGISRGNAKNKQATALLQDFLKRFGYLTSESLEAQVFATARDTSLPRATTGDFDGATESALCAFQKFYGLPVTGILDEATVAAMAQPRCGCPDQSSHGGLGQFVAQTGGWDKTDLTYRIVNGTPDLSEEEIRASMRQAFDLWAAVTHLTFTEVSGDADILISFEIGDHGDGSPFDGVGRVLAHAFFPAPGLAIAGDAHFDDAETWAVTIPIPEGSFDLVTVAAHEFGHSLGLGHSDVRGALMFPTHSGVQRFLHEDDIAGIQSLYGASRRVQSSWIHGHSLQVEYPDRLARIWRPGFYAEVEGHPSTDNWFHFAIPTLTVVNHRRLRVESVMLAFDALSPDVQVRDVHIYDGETPIARHNGVLLSGNVPFIRFDIPNTPEVRRGIGISIGVNFGTGAGARVIRFKSVGCDFLSEI